MSFPAPGVLFVTIVSTVGSKKSGWSLASRSSRDSPVRAGKLAPEAAAAGSSREGFRAALEHELPGRQVVMRPCVQPEQLRVPLDLREHCRIDTTRMNDDF